MNETSQEIVEPANLTLLRRLVTTLLITMIIGFVALIVMLVIRFSPSAPTGETPDWITSLPLPENTTIVGITKGDGFYAATTHDGQILIYGPDFQLRKTLSAQ